MTDSAISGLPVEHFTTRRQAGTNNNNNRRAIAASRQRTRTKADFVQYRTRWWARVIPVTFSIAVVVVLSIGWLNRDDNGLTPVSGVGYWLGIAGSGLMLLLLLYPLRKRLPSLQVIGTVAFWFRAHMILGVVGSALILWHANFRLGSINSSVALVTMLVVAMSGIVGRYLYRKVHLGLYGRKAEVREILADIDLLKALFDLFAEILDYMCEIGAAYESAPDVEL